MKFEILNDIRNRITELDDLLWEMSITDYRDAVALRTEFDKLNKILRIAEGE